MEMWIIITIFAAFVQNLRFVVQKYMTTTGFSAEGAIFARFIYAAPVLMILTSLWVFITGELPEIRFSSFLFWGMLGGMAQTIASFFVVSLFKTRNFSVGISLKKTETILSAFIGFLILGDRISLVGILTIITGLFGVILLSDKSASFGRKGVREKLFGRAVFYGLGSGLFFGISAVAYRATTFAIESDDFIMRVLFSVTIANCFQVFILWLWLNWKCPGEAQKIIKSWYFSVPVSSFSLIGSIGWFSAFALQPVAYVFALGQIEVIFALCSSMFLFKEKLMLREICGTIILTVSIIILVTMG